MSSDLSASQRAAREAINARRRVRGTIVYDVACDGKCGARFVGTHAERRRAKWAQRWRRVKGLEHRVDLCPSCRSGASTSPPEDAGLAKPKRGRRRGRGLRKGMGEAAAWLLGFPGSGVSLVAEMLGYARRDTAYYRLEALVEDGLARRKSGRECSDDGEYRHNEWRYWLTAEGERLANDVLDA